ncbi:CCA tRNA nucleotidyltransferase [Virgibacillus salarius]
MVIDMYNESFQKAIKVIERIEGYHHQAFFVGGCVRDYLLNRPVGDIDIATSATPEFLQEIFHNVIPVGIEHGTVIVRFEKESFEVTTFRVDGSYSDQRHPDSVTYIDKIDKDLARRDFTINALAMSRHGAIIDLFQGKQDLENRIIRTVGNGRERFMEDPLRIIRALRFSSQLGFKIDETTLKHMKQVKQQIGNLAIERITNEFTKFFAGNYISQGCTYLRDTGVYKYLPVFKDHEQLFHDVASIKQPLYSFGEVMAVCHLLKPSLNISMWTKAWKCSNKVKNEAIQLSMHIDTWKKLGVSPLLVYQLPEYLYESFVRVASIVDPTSPIQLTDLWGIYETLPIKSRTELAVNGNDIIRLFPSYKKGPWINDLLNNLEKQIVLHGLPNQYETIKEWIKWNPPEIS